MSIWFFILIPLFLWMLFITAYVLAACRGAGMITRREETGNDLCFSTQDNAPARVRPVAYEPLPVLEKAHPGT